MSVEGPKTAGRDFGPSLAFDNMADRLITGTQDLKRYEVVLDVPGNASALNFGSFLNGTGQMWVDDIKLEVVGKDVPSTDLFGSSQPGDMGFEDGLSPWFWSGEHIQKYRYGTDSQVLHGGKASAYVNTATAGADEDAGLLQIVSTQAYAGKRISFSAYLKTQNVENWAGLEVQVNDVSGNILAEDNMEYNSVSGTTDWKEYNIVVDVPENAFQIRFGPYMKGTGKVWIDDAQLKVVGNDVTVTSPTITPGSKP
jgi:hypothetical protein